MPIADRNHDYARSVLKKLEEAGIRCELDVRNEKIGFKIREAQMEKVPYMLVLGDKEEESGQIAARIRKTGETEVMSRDAFLEKVLGEIRNRVLS